MNTRPTVLLTFLAALWVLLVPPISLAAPGDLLGRKLLPERRLRGRLEGRGHAAGLRAVQADEHLEHREL